MSRETRRGPGTHRRRHPCPLSDRHAVVAACGIPYGKPLWLPGSDEPGAVGGPRALVARRARSARRHTVQPQSEGLVAMTARGSHVLLRHSGAVATSSARCCPLRLTGRTLLVAPGLSPPSHPSVAPHCCTAPASRRPSGCGAVMASSARESATWTVDLRGRLDELLDGLPRSAPRQREQSPRDRLRSAHELDRAGQPWRSGETMIGGQQRR